ncbi:unannotated protein [freshwater metagenome]|uniref:Unannotated protein n=1 Tax=freshwater metagenome TaxID=449393 RepID=A0A6J6NWI1_9ZZZZ
MKMSRLAALSAAAIALTLSLSACSPTVSLEPAADANNPGCADVIVRLPDAVDGQESRTTNAQSTAAWGNPATVILRCGIEPVEISTLPCVTANGVDWIVDDSAKPSFRFISFGRTPALEVIVDSENAVGVNALDSLAEAVKSIEPTKECVS